MSIADETWTCVELTPSTVRTPHGHISVAWTSTDGTAQAKAEEVARAIASLPALVRALRKIVTLDQASDSTEIALAALREAGVEDA